LGLGTRQIGLVYTFAGGGYAIGSVAAGGRLGGRSPRTSVGVASVVTGLALGLALLLANVWMAMPLLLVGGLAAAIVGVGVVTLLAAESPAGAGTTMVLNGSLLNVGAAGGAALGGALIALGGYHALGLGLPMFAFAAAVVAWWPVDHERTGAGA
jgi:predicted MFS family arabinose efflux permease